MHVLEHRMEQYLMNFNNFEANMKVLNMSWEEQAFADDVAGHLGGFVWPPRSYSCNFCSREFRSAQALGGHMNVHRRDRARLKQNIETIPQNDQNQTNHPISIPCKSVESSYPSEDLHHEEQGPGLHSSTRSRWDCKLAINDARKELDFASSNQPTEFCSTYDLEVIDTRKKQKKTAAASSLMDFVRPCSNDILSSSSEDLDLELRLGETPNDKLK